MRRSVWLVGLMLIACGDPVDESERTDIEQLDACGLPEPCSRWVSWEGCAFYEGWTYKDYDVCSFAALAGDEPTVIRAVHSEPVCGDIVVGTALNAYRWADGSMTCIVTDLVGQAAGAVACSLPDAALIESCLGAAQAGEQVTQACLDWEMWGLELGEPVDAECGPLP